MFLQETYGIIKDFSKRPKKKSMYDNNTFFFEKINTFIASNFISIIFHGNIESNLLKTLKDDVTFKLIT